MSGTNALLSDVATMITATPQAQLGIISIRVERSGNRLGTQRRLRHVVAAALLLAGVPGVVAAQTSDFTLLLEQQHAPESVALQSPANGRAIEAWTWWSGGQGVRSTSEHGVQGERPRVEILNPEPEAVTGARVPVVLKAVGVVIAPVHEHRPGTAHFHLFLDRDLTPLDSAIPTGAGITHLSSGSSWFMLEALKPGPHRLIAVLADAEHVPLRPLVSDTVHFTVKQHR